MDATKGLLEISLKLKTMLKSEVKSHIEHFGLIKAGKVGYLKEIHGTIKEVDNRGDVWFLDTNGIANIFKCEEISSFEPKDFAKLPEKNKGREIYWDGGKAYYKDLNSECDLKK